MALIGSGLVLVVGILALILSLKGCEKKPDPAQTTQTEPDLTVIHLAAAGDLNVTQKVIGNRSSYTDTFMDVAAILADADLTAVNFEGGLYGAPYGEDASAPPALAEALKSAGVDLVQLANSYTIYKGTAGLAATVSGMGAAGLTPVGAWATPDDAKKAGGYTLCEVEGVKIAFVSFTKGMDGMALPAGSEGCVNLLYTDYATAYQEVDTQGITKVLNAVSKEKPDLTVALLHWGSEFNDTISASQTEIVTLMQENGVDAIIGTHSHYVQKMTLDPNTGMFVAYSLGDFLGDADRAGSEYSVILDLEITKNNTTGETKVTGYSYTPIFNVTDKGDPRVVRIDTAVTAYENGYIDRVSDTAYQAMKYALERIDARIGGE
nr:CapA family protein [Oscillospiraceae bacterium]